MKTLKKILQRVVWTAVLVVGAYYGWQYWQARSAAQEEQGIGEVPTQAVTVSDITVSVSANGVLRPVKIVQVKSKAQGEILEMPVELGDEVRAGQIIAQIDTRTLQQEYNQAEADLENQKIRLEVAESQYNRAVELQKQDLVSQQDLDSSRQNYSAAKAALLRAEADIELRQERLDDATVRAPSAGRIIKKDVEVGTIIASSLSNVSGGTTLVEMADLSRLEVRTLVDEIDIGRVKAGLPVEITVDAYPDRTFRGQVVKIEPQSEVQQQVTYFPVLSFIDNSEGLLLPGMNANVDVIIHRRNQVLTAPNEAVREPADARRVAEMLGLPYDEATLRQGDAQLTDAGERPAMRGAAYADEPGAPQETGGAPAGAAAAGPGQEAGATAEPARDQEGGKEEGDKEEDGKEEEVDFSRMRDMSQEERREFMASLTDKQRAQLRERMAAMFGGGGGRPGGGRDGNAGSMDAFGIGQAPQERVVFIMTAEGALQPRLVMAGVQDWENTEIVSGLQPGEEVVLLPSTSLLMSQQAMRDRFSRFASGPLGNTGSRR